MVEHARTGRAAPPNVRGSAVAIPEPLDEIHLRLLKAIQANPQATQRELSEALGVSLGKAHYCLRALVDKGWVKAQNFRANPHKIGYAYLLTPSGMDAKARLTLRFLRRKLDEYDMLRAEIEELRREAEL